MPHAESAGESPISTEIPAPSTVDGSSCCVQVLYTSVMVSRDDLKRLKTWQLQLKAAVAAQEQRLKSMDRQRVKTGTVTEPDAPFVRSLETAILVCKNTLTQFEEACRHLAMLIDFYGRQGSESPPPGAALTPLRQMQVHRFYNECMNSWPALGQGRLIGVCNDGTARIIAAPAHFLGIPVAWRLLQVLRSRSGTRVLLRRD